MLSASLLPASSPRGLGNFAEPRGAARVSEGAAGRAPPAEAAALRSPSENVMLEHSRTLGNAEPTGGDRVCFKHAAGSQADPSPPGDQRGCGESVRSIRGKGPGKNGRQLGKTCGGEVK